MSPPRASDHHGATLFLPPIHPFPKGVEARAISSPPSPLDFRPRGLSCRRRAAARLLLSWSLHLRTPKGKCTETSIAYHIAEMIAI